MATVEQLHTIANDLLSNKLRQALQLKQQILDDLDTVNETTNNQIYKLWTELEKIYDQNQSRPIIKTNTNSNTKRRRGRKRKHPLKSSPKSSTNHNNKEPPKKRQRTGITSSSDSDNNNDSKVFTFKRSKGSTSSRSSSTRSSMRTHRKLTMTSTATDTMNTTNNEINNDNDDDNDGHYLHKMLKNAEHALELTDKNMNILQNCVESVDMFRDKLDGDILEFGDEIRKS